MRRRTSNIIKCVVCISAAILMISSTAFAYAEDTQLTLQSPQEVAEEAVIDSDAAATEPSDESITDQDGLDEENTVSPEPISERNYEIESQNFTYTGAAIEPTVTVDGLFQNTDYTVTYKNNVNVGLGYAYLKGIGNYSGTVKLSFKINPVGTRITSFVPNSKAFDVSWNMQAEQTSGYVVRYSSSSTMATYKTIYLADPAITSTSISSLKVDTKYYVMIKTYALVDGHKYYSDWSRVYTTKTYKAYTVLKTLSKANTPKVQKISGKTSKFCPQSMAYLGSGNYVIAYSNTSQGDKEQYLKKYVGGKAVKNVRAYLGHANGLCYNPNTKLLYSVRGSSDLVKRYSNTLEKKSDKHLSITLSGLAYDRKTGNYYASRAAEIFVLDKNFNVIKRINKMGAWRYAQDIGGYNGYIYSCVCLDKNKGNNRINIYKASTGQYVGTYEVNWNENEIEDCEVDEKGRLLILMNIHHTGTDYVFRTKSSLAK